VLRSLLDAATTFKEKHGRPPVLIIDDINNLAKKHPQELEDLQDFAKTWADNQSLIVVFVSSEGNGPRLLQRKLVHLVGRLMYGGGE
jgi:chromosomal replication initiation ATPase DnaA